LGRRDRILAKDGEVLKTAAMARRDGEFVWLWEAPERFGPKKLVAASKAENAPRIFKNPTEFPEKFEDRMAIINDIAKQIFPPKPSTEELHAIIAEMIQDGELEAFGIQLKPAAGLEPERVPLHMFSDPLRVNWDGSRVKRSGREYEQIKVRRRVEQTSEPSVPPPIKSHQPRPNGRPTKQDEIHRVIDEIAEAGFDLNSINREPACHLIRTEAIKRGLNTAIGYSDPVLKRAINLKLGPRQ
jgi:hypothetical protein